MRVSSSSNGTEFWMTPEEYDVIKKVINSVYAGDSVSSVEELEILKGIEDAIEEEDNSFWNKKEDSF